MKYKNYGDKNEEYADGSSLELITFSDPLSARSVNRPIANIYEDQKEVYKLLNNIYKTVYGNIGNSILPDIYEEFAPEGFVINSFKNDTTKYFLRIPSGMMLLNKNTSSSEGKKNGNPFSSYGEYDYIDEDSKDNYSKDVESSFVFDNRPNLSLLERQLANFIALDLTDLTNDINIHQDDLPMMFPVQIINKFTKYQNKDPDGNLSFVTDNGGNFLYICENEENAMYYLEDVKTKNKKINYIYTPQGSNDKFFEENYKSYNEKIYYIELNDGEKVNLSTKKPSGKDYVCLTSNVKDAKYVKDYNGNTKKTLGYYLDVNRATSEDDEVTYLPNRKENAFWKVCLPYGGIIGAEGKKEEYTYRIYLYDQNDKEITRWEFFFYDYASEENINNMLFNKLLTEGEEYFNLSKYQFRVNGSEIKHGIKISCKSESSNCDNYKLKIYYVNREEEYICTTQDTSTGWVDNKIDKVLPEKAQRQKYYNNIFELTNAFLGRFSSYQVSIGNIYNYLSGETILYLPSINNFSIYYDLENDRLNNKDNINYDKTGKLLISTEDLSPNRFIKLYDLSLEKPAGAGFSPRIKEVTCYIKNLDRRLIGTKRAELNSLLSKDRTNLKNYIKIEDFDGNRKLEIVEDNEDPDKEQTRLVSPIYRMSTKESITDIKPDSWTDKNNGDTPSDFNDSFSIRNFETNNTKIMYHDNKDMGIIIDKNKGIKIYNNDIEKLDDKETNKITKFKPIEISSNEGNINIFNENSDTSRIGIRNLKDSENNIIDLLGITRIRSKNNYQLVVRSINESEKNSIPSSIAFVQGNTSANQNTNALSKGSGKEYDDVVAGSIEFTTGLDDSDSENKVLNNRMLSLKLSESGSNKYLNSVLDARNAKSASSKKIVTMYGDVSPSGEYCSIGFPIGSRTYIDDVSHKIPYIKNKYLKVDKFGNSTEYINKEDRWMSLFVKDGYLGSLTLADRTDDIKNNDTRSGSLRMGNSNIYDISSIYINCDNTDGNNARSNFGTINFDNGYSDVKENSITSRAPEELNSSICFTINRELENNPSLDTEAENNANGFTSLKLNLEGAEIGKDLEVKRQLFVNNHKEASENDNNALVVKGQSIMNGELILGKGENFSVNIEKYAKGNGYTGDSTLTHHNKKYNSEYSDRKDDTTLFTFRNYGKTYLDGDVTLSKGSKFTDNMPFDKSITVKNNAYGGNTYDFFNNDKDRLYYSNNKFNGDFESEDDKEKSISRHHIALNVHNGTILLGSKKDSLTNDFDPSDLILNGSQYIKRRMEIGNNEPVLIDTYMNSGNLIEDGYTIDQKGKVVLNSDNKINESPSLYVNGASSFSGDVVFGGNLHESTYTDPDDKKSSWNYKYMKNHRIENETENNAEKPIKAIFWGKSWIDSKNNNYDAVITDFDFHGSAWFDNLVKIGCSEEDVGSSDSYNKNGRLYIKGNKKEEWFSDNETWGKQKAALRVEGSLSVFNSGHNSLRGKTLDLMVGNSDSIAHLYLGGKSTDEHSGTGSMYVNAGDTVEIFSNISTNKITMNSDGITNESNGSFIKNISGTTSETINKNGSIVLNAKDYSNINVNNKSIEIGCNKLTNSITIDSDSLETKVGTGSYIKIDRTNIKSKSTNIEIDGSTVLKYGTEKNITIDDSNVKMEDKGSIVGLSEKGIDISTTENIKVHSNNIIDITSGNDKLKVISISSNNLEVHEAIEIFKEKEPEKITLNLDGTIVSVGGYYNGQVGDVSIRNKIYSSSIDTTSIDTTSISCGSTEINSNGIDTNSITVSQNAAISGNISCNNITASSVGTSGQRCNIYVNEIYCNGYKLVFN